MYLVHMSQIEGRPLSVAKEGNALVHVRMLPSQVFDGLSTPFFNFNAIGNRLSFCLA